MVTGGVNFPGETATYNPLDSTEILDTTGETWRTLTTARLPTPRNGVRGGTVNNVVFIFGENGLGFHKNSQTKYYFLTGGNDNTTILSFDKSEESWQPAGQMTVPRWEFAVEVIEDVSKLCQQSTRNKVPDSNLDQSRLFPAFETTTHPPTTHNNLN